MDKKYLFVVFTTLATRFCIEDGMNDQGDYNMIDLVIQQLDKCSPIYNYNNF